MKRNRYAVIVAAVLLLTVLTAISPIVAAKPPKITEHFIIQAAGHEGGWIAGRIYEGTTTTYTFYPSIGDPIDFELFPAKGSGSICNLDFRTFPPTEAHGLVWQVEIVAARWYPGTGDLVIAGNLYAPKLKFGPIGPLVEVFSGLEEGHNEIMWPPGPSASRHIIGIQVMP